MLARDLFELTKISNIKLIMKKNIFVIILLAALFSIGCSLTNKMYFQRLYSIETEVKEDIDGQIVSQKALIYKKNGLATNKFVHFEKMSRNGDSFFIELTYNGMDWVFYDTFRIKADGETYSLEPDVTSRDVIGSNNVVEKYIYFVPEDLVSELNIAKTLTIQFDGNPIILPREAIQTIGNLIPDS